MHLKTWLEVNKIRQHDFAEKIGITRSYLCSILNGHRKCGKYLAKRIEKHTKGDISYDDIVSGNPFPKKI